MADLTISTLSVLDAVAAGVRVTAELCDSEKNILREFTDDGLLVHKAHDSTDDDGLLVLDLIPNENVNRANTYYLVTVGAEEFLIEKGSGAETLDEARAFTPGELGTAAGLDNLVDVDTTGKTSGMALAWDGSGWVATDMGTQIELNAEATARAARDTTLSVSRFDSFGHSFGQLGATSGRFLFWRRIADRLGCVANNRHVSGSKLTAIGARSGGYANLLQRDEPPVRSYNAQNYTPRVGVGSLLTGINDVQAYATVGDWAQLLACMLHEFRVCLSWEQLGAWWQHDESSTGQAFAGSGVWSSAAYVTALELGPGANRRKNATAGGTYTVTTCTAEAGYVAVLGFLTNFTGGTVAASSISFTLDGAAATLLSGGSTLDTRDIVPASIGTGGMAVARIALPNDAATHSIVATSGTGGMEVCGHGVEIPRPFALCNVPRRGGDDGYTPNGTAANIAALNAALVTLVAEFSSGLVKLADIDGALGALAAYFADDLHPNDTGHELIARTILDALDALSLTAQQRGML